MFSLTRQERQVILFLICVALAGMGVNFLAKRYTPIKSIICFEKDIGKIDLNKADFQVLVDLPGIGEKLAQRIIAYRKQKGGFKNIEELKNIKGMNSYRYEKLKGQVVVGE